MNDKLSQYAEEQFGLFLKNKKLQDSLTDMIVFMNLSTPDDVGDLCLTIFLSNIDVNRLQPSDLKILKSEIREIRAAGITYPPISDAYPDPTNEFIKTKLEDRIKAGYSSGYDKVIDQETGTVRIPL